MAFARAVAGLIAILAALVVMAPLPAAAGPTVSSQDLVCADITFSYGLSVSQRPGASGDATLKLVGPSNSNLQIQMKALGLPPSSPAFCAVLCVVDGVLDIFNFAAFDPCTTTTAAGKLNFTTTIAFTGSEPFDGGCFLSVPAFLVGAEPPVMAAANAASDGGSLVLCAPGFGTFESFPPPCITSTSGRLTCD